MLSHLLDHGNHPRVRIQGFQLLLLWLNDQTIELSECMHLYSNAISLDLFLYDQIKGGGVEDHNNNNNNLSNINNDNNIKEGRGKLKKSNISTRLGQVLIKCIYYMHKYNHLYYFLLLSIL